MLRGKSAQCQERERCSGKARSIEFTKEYEGVYFARAHLRVENDVSVEVGILFNAHKAGLHQRQLTCRVKRKWLNVCKIKESKIKALT